jgi:predicted DNA-binding mobile mystery protein A
MNYGDRKLIREQLDQKLNSIKEAVSSSMPSQGWIKSIREALGISTAQLGKKVGIDQSRISRIENAEMTGEVKLSTLMKIAKSMDMQLVYAFVPKNSLEDMVYQQARQIALKRMKRLNTTMRLEEQELSSEQKQKALEDMVNKIMIDEPKDFWD